MPTACSVCGRLKSGLKYSRIIICINCTTSMTRAWRHRSVAAHGTVVVGGGTGGAGPVCEHSDSIYVNTSHLTSIVCIRWL